jgi:hypothetical protein
MLIFQALKIVQINNTDTEQGSLLACIANSLLSHTRNIREFIIMVKKPM